MKALGGRIRAGRPVLSVVSSGGTVFDDRGRVLLLRKADEGRWCIPKGHIEEGETPEAAALREIREESGLVCQIVGYLTEVHYEYYWPSEDVNYAKTVKYFLAEVVGGSLQLEQGFDRSRWCTEPQALQLLAYENDQRVVREAFQRMARPKSPQARKPLRSL